MSDLPTVEQARAQRASLSEGMCVGAGPSDGQTVSVEVDMPGIGAAHPLAAPYCAERAAFAISRAETAPSANMAGQLLSSAEQWRHLAIAMATNATLNRPKEDDRNRR